MKPIDAIQRQGENVDGGLADAERAASSAYMASFHARSAAEFLSARGLQIDDLVATAMQQYPDAVQVLLTSSAVHGIANSASDIDLICLRQGGNAERAMATQVHAGDTHFEVVAFHESQVDECATLLGSGMAGGLADRRRIHAQIGEGDGIPAKYLERICTGVNQWGGLPNLRFHAELCDVWAAAGFDRAREAALCCAMAARAQESRAAVGYAVNALLHLMNALLAHDGWPLMNKKWTLKRWRMAADVLQANGLLADLRPAIDEVWNRSISAMGGSLDDAKLQRLASLVDRAGDMLQGGATAAWPAPVVEGLDEASFLPGARFLVDSARGAATLLPDVDLALPAGPMRVADYLELPQAQACAWLALARAGLVSLSIA